MSGCHDHGCGGDTAKGKAALWLALVLNLGMFSIEIWQGHAADSTSLLADSMDFLSDSFSYALSLAVFSMAVAIRAKAALIKAVLMLSIAAIVLVTGLLHIIHDAVPMYQTMGWVGLLALAVNVISALALYSARGRDSNMRSVWLCSRNDAIGNVAILIAAYFIYLTGTLWPDLIVAAIMAWLGISAALKIISHAKQELQEHHEH